MPPASALEITQLLQAWSGGDAQALARLMSVVYPELRRSARRHMAHQPPDHTLEATGLVHEVYLRLAKFHESNWKDRAHFYAVCAQEMRRILVDSARRRQADRRGGGAQRVDFDDALTIPAQGTVDLVAVDEALHALETVDPRKSRVVELRFFGGLKEEEVAAVLHVSKETVQRDWRLAKLWLWRELNGRHPDGA